MNHSTAQALNKGSLYVLISFFFLVACTTEKAKEKQETYLVASPIVKDTSFINEYVAEIQSIQNVEIRSRTTGFIEKQFIDEGRGVVQGQMLFKISSKLLQQNLQSAKSVLRSTLAELKSAEIEMENTSKLLEKNIVSKTEMELMKSKVEEMNAKVEEMKAEVAEAEHSLSLAEIRAPFSGIINRIPNKIGSLVEEGTLLTSISNNSHMLVYFNVSETVYLDYISSKNAQKQTEVSMVLANDEKYPQKGIIETIEGEFDKSTGNIAFRAKFPNPKQILKHGSSGKILIESKLKNALLIPQKATFEIQDNTYVYVLDSGNVVRQRKIVPKLRMRNLFVVGSGLTAQDRFVMEGVQLVKDGDKIAPQAVSPAEVLKSLPH